MSVSLSSQERCALQVLGFFFYQTGRTDSALRTVQALLAADPDDSWAKYMQILCADAAGDYARVLELTEHLSDDKKAATTAEQHQALLLLRARALQKSGRTPEAQQVLQQRLTELQALQKAGTGKGEGKA